MQNGQPVNTVPEACWELFFSSASFIRYKLRGFVRLCMIMPPPNDYDEPQQAFFFGFSGTASVTFIEVPLAGAAIASSEARVFFDTM